MIIKRNTYEALSSRAKLANELEKEVKRLAALITAKTKDCKIGPWCKDCTHRGIDYSEVVEYDWSGNYTLIEGGKVYYCKKHLHEMCPEFEQVIANGK